MAVLLALAARPASAEVTERGSFASSVAIQVPAFHGIEPAISLVYDSTRPNGLLGVGWRLEAASYITRAGRQGGAPRFEPGDVFMLDGEQLVECAPSCPSGGTHETRNRDFTRIRFHDGRWTRWRRDGVRFEYEPLPFADSRGTYRWALERVVDTHANTVVYKHSCDIDCYLDSIAYADGSNGATGARIRFHYGGRFDASSYGTGGNLAVTLKILRTIEVRMAGGLVRAYALDYEPSRTNGSSLLRSVQTFPSDATVDASGTVTAGETKPQPPSVFTTPSMSDVPGGWGWRRLPALLVEASLPADRPGNPSYSPVFNGVGIANVTHELHPHGQVTGDFDGDARLDAARWAFPDGGCGDIRVTTVLAHDPRDPRTSENGTVNHSSRSRCTLSVWAANVNGDSADDLLFMGNDGWVRVATSGGDGRFWFAEMQTHTGFVVNSGNNNLKPPAWCSVAELDGDGLSDLACVYQAGRTMMLGTARARPDGGFEVKAAPLLAHGVRADKVRARPDRLKLMLGDVNADGKAELVVADPCDSDDVGAPCPMWKLTTVYVSATGEIEHAHTDRPGWPNPSNVYTWDLSSGDFNNDARADVALVRAEDENGRPKDSDIVYVATSTGAAAADAGTPRFDLRLPNPVQLQGSATVVADVDGDGRDDLVTNSTPGHALATYDGRFDRWTKTDGTACERTIAQDPTVGDTNGDGKEDVVCLSHDSESTVVKDGVSPNRPADLHRWMPADITGSGRQSLVYVHFRNPGYQVYTLTRTGGDFEQSSKPIDPQPGLPPQPRMPLDNPDAGAWMPIDVGRPGLGAGADGKTDLVLVERDGETLRVNTLLSTGTGWEPKADTPWRVNGAATPYGSADVQNWRPAKLNRDGCADLIHLVPTGPGVRVNYLLSNCDGSWTSGRSRNYFATATEDAPALTAVNVRGFQNTDIDGNWPTDLTFVEAAGDTTLIRTLVGNGDGSWTEHTNRQDIVLTPAEARAVRRMDVNGDGMSDLALIRPDNGCLSVTAFLSTGDAGPRRGRFTGGWRLDDSHNPDPPCEAPGNGEDTNNIRVLDLNEDNRDDVLQLSRRLVRTGDHDLKPITTAHVLLNLSGNRPGGRWSVITEPLEGYATIPDSWNFGEMDTNSDGHGELFHISPELLVHLHWRTDSDRLSGIDNGRGATTHVAYRSLPAARSYLPAGALPTVVDHVTTRDAAHSPPVEETTRWAYDGARWSDEHKQLLGFERVQSTQGGSVAATRYELTDACGARAAAGSLDDTQGKPFTFTESTFVDPGSGPVFTCLTKRVTQRDCEREPDCSSDTHPLGTTTRSKVRSVEYDRFGNVTQVLEGGGHDLRRTTTDYRPNTEDYVIDRPAREQTHTWEPEGGQGSPWRWQQLAATEYIYDDNTGWDSPPSAKGELRRKRRWNDRSDDFVEDTFDYDERGNVTLTTSPTGVVERTHYDRTYSVYPVMRCTPAVCTKQSWKITFGVPATGTDANGQVTHYRYDAYGRQTKVTAPDGSTSSTAYLDEGRWQGPDSQRQRIRTEQSDGSAGDQVLWQERLLDGLGRVYKTRREGDGSGDIVTEMRFADASARPAAISDPHLADSEPVWTAYEYDEAHRPTKTVLPDGATSTTVYRLAIYRRFPWASPTLKGWASVTRDPLGRETTAVRDALGRTVRVEELNREPCPGCPPTIHTTSYAYDLLDRRTRITDDAGNVTETRWDSLGRKVSERDPDRGQRGWTWRDDGTPDTATDAKHQTTSWTYDKAGRTIKREEHKGDGTLARSTTWTWDRDTNGETHGHSLGRVVRVGFSSSVASGSTDSWYDRMGRVKRTRQCAAGSCAQLRFKFDQAGRLATLTYPDGKGTLSDNSERVTHCYDTAGRLLSVTGRSATSTPGGCGDPATNADTVYASELRYDPLGQLERLEHSNGVIDSRSYDPRRHWIDALEVTRTDESKPLYSASYGHHPDANISRLTETAATPYTEEYHYDDLSRLTRVSASDAGRSREYSYDATGRMTSSSTTGGYHYDDPAHVHAPTATDNGHRRTYDANGNLMTLRDPRGRRLTLKWTISDMPERMTSRGGSQTVMGYDADDRRVLRRNRNGTTYYFGRYLERNRSGRLVKHYWAGSQLIARRVGNRAPTQLHQDRLGSTRLLTDATGNVVERHDYDAFGKPLRPPTREERLWRGQRHDQDSGLIYMNARFYDPELGRFASPDSIIAEPYNPQSLDRYAYTFNDPVNHSDPSGHIPRDIELKKEQEQQGLLFGWMYSRTKADQNACATYTLQCPQPTYNHIPGQAEPQRDGDDSDTPRDVSDPGEEFVGGDDSDTPPDVSDPGEEFVGGDDSDTPPDVSDPIAEGKAPPVQSITFPDDEIVVSSDRADLEMRLAAVRYRMRYLQADMEKTRQDAKSNWLGAVPGLGWLLAMGYDAARGESGEAAKNVIEEEAEKSIERAAKSVWNVKLPPGWAAPNDAGKIHDAMRAHGDRVNEMEALKLQEYRLMDRLGSPDARYDLGGNYYLGAGGMTYDKRTGTLIHRIQK